MFSLDNPGGRHFQLIRSDGQLDSKQTDVQILIPIAGERHESWMGAEDAFLAILVTPKKWDEAFLSLKRICQKMSMGACTKQPRNHFCGAVCLQYDCYCNMQSPKRRG